MILTDTTQLDKRTEMERELDRIRGIPAQSERWQAIRKFMWVLNPENKLEDMYHRKEVAKDREENLYNPKARSKSGRQQRLVSVPTYLYLAIKTADPEFDDEQKTEDSKRLWHKFWHAFPEYRIAERLDT